MISTAIKAKREGKGWSKKYLGDLLGVSSAAIGQYEKGDNKPKIEVLLKLNKVFNYDFINDKPIEESVQITPDLSPESNIALKANKKNNNYSFRDSGEGGFPYKALPKKQPETMQFVGVPMYNIPASASLVEMYGDANDVKIVGHLTIPGATKDSFALPVHGHSMYPTLENGSWCVLRPLSDRTDIEWGEIYYIEYGDYRMYKRLLKADDEDSVILWSDNQSEVINDRPKYAAKTIKKEKIRRLCLLTDILKKPNY